MNDYGGMIFLISFLEHVVECGFSSERVIFSIYIDEDKTNVGIRPAVKHHGVYERTRPLSPIKSVMTILQIPTEITQWLNEEYVLLLHPINMRQSVHLFW
jgi:hypothetical protein